MAHSNSPLAVIPGRSRSRANPESFSNHLEILRYAIASHQEYTLAVDLLVEQLIGLLGLVELPAMGEQLIDVYAALDRKARAFGLDDVRKCPGCDQRQLPAEQMRADVDMHVAAFADEAHGPPYLGGADRVQPRVRIARRIERQVGVTAVGEVLDRRDRIVRAGIDHGVGAEDLGPIEPLLADIKRDHSRAH